MSLNYETTNWENGKTVLKAEHLRKIEKGITDIIAENDAIYTDEDTRKSNEKQRQEEHSRKMNEVSEVVSDIQKDYDSLQKIIIDENASANLQNQINQTNSQLEHIEKQIKPSGKNDDTDYNNIVDAIAKYKTIKLLDGNFTLTKKISVPSGRYISGKGINNTKIIYKGVDCAFDFSSLTTATRESVLSDMCIVLENDCDGILLKNSTYHSFNNIKIMTYANIKAKEQFATGVHIIGMEGESYLSSYFNKFYGCIFAGLKIGVSIEQSGNNNKFTSCEFYGDDIGVIIKDSQLNTFISPTFQDFTTKAVEIADNDTNTTVSNMIMSGYIEPLLSLMDTDIVCGIEFKGNCRFNYLVGNFYSGMIWKGIPNVIDEKHELTTNARIEWVGSPDEAMHVSTFLTPPIYNESGAPGARKANRGGFAIFQNENTDDKLITVVKNADGTVSNKYVPLIDHLKNTINLYGITLFNPNISLGAQSYIKLGTKANYEAGSIWWQKSKGKLAIAPDESGGFNYAQTIKSLGTDSLNSLDTSLLVRGEMAYNTDYFKPVWWDGSKWRYSDGSSMQ